MHSKWLYCLWKSLNLSRRVLVADRKNLKGGEFDSPWGEVGGKAPRVRPCSHWSHHKKWSRCCVILYIYCTVHVNTKMFPWWFKYISWATINSWKKTHLISQFKYALFKLLLVTTSKLSITDLICIPRDQWHMSLRRSRLLRLPAHR